MSNPQIALKRPYIQRWTRLGVAVFVGSGLLTGCAMWPKSLTLPFFGSAEPEPITVAAAEPAPAAAPAKPAAVIVPAVPVPVATAAPVSEPPKMESTLIAGVPAESMSAATKASLGVQTPAATAAAPAKATAAPLARGELVPGFYLNVGLFAVASNGVNAHKKLEAAGMPVFSDGIVNKKGALTRVRVGPFESKALAQSAAQKIQAMKLEAVVFQK